ncbi:uncharacterized protein [Periplaneta americana]|uniref:uncharacterized protein n=1 Tax=Periplaneta americana TaxID=6978 RepID=UPI0037E76508
MRVPVIHMFVRSIQLLKLVCCLSYAFYAVTSDDSEGNEKAFTNTIHAEETLPSTDLTSDIYWTNETGLNTSNEEKDYTHGEEFQLPAFEEGGGGGGGGGEEEEEEEEEVKFNDSIWNESNETTPMNVSDECLQLLAEFGSLLDEHEAIFVLVNESVGTNQFNLIINSVPNMTEVRTFITNVIEHKKTLIAAYDELDKVITQMSEVCPPALFQNVAGDIRVHIKLLRDIISEVNIGIYIPLTQDELLLFNFSCSLFDVEDCKDKIDHIIDRLKIITKVYDAIMDSQRVHEIVSYIMFVIGIIGNSILLIVFLKHKEMRTLPNWMILNMTIADFLVIFINPLSIEKYIVNRDWYFHLEWCVVEVFSSYLVFYGSTYSIIAMNVQRSIAICISYSCTRFSFTKCHFVLTFVSV